MKSGTLIAIVVLAAYVGLEAYTIRHASQRMKPSYIHNLLVEAKEAAELCTSPVLELEDRFTRTLERATDSYREALTEEASESEQSIEQQLTEKTAAARTKVAQEVELKGCSHPDIKAHFQRYRIYAKKTR